MWAVVFAVIAAALAGLLTGAIHLIRQQGHTVGQQRNEIGILNQEIRVLNDSIARAGRMPIMRSSPIGFGKLEKLDNWFDGPARIEKVVAG